MLTHSLLVNYLDLPALVTERVQVNLDNSRGQRRLKNEFIFYLRISRYSKVIYLVYHCQNYRKTKSGTQR